MQEGFCRLIKVIKIFCNFLVVQSIIPGEKYQTIKIDGLNHSKIQASADLMHLHQATVCSNYFLRLRSGR